MTMDNMAASEIGFIEENFEILKIAGTFREKLEEHTCNF